MGNVTAKTSGDIASFMTPAETNIKSLKVHFSPKQLGTGDPSPENVREIVGWDGVEVNGCGKNLVPWIKTNLNIQSDHYNGFTGWSELWEIPKRFSYTYSVFIDNSNCSTDGGARVWLRDIDNSKYTHVVAGNKIKAGEKGLSTVTLNFSNLPNDYYACWGLELYQNAIASRPIVYESDQGTTIPIDFTNNYLNKVQITNNKTINSTGEEITESGMSMTDYIPVNENEEWLLHFVSTATARTRRIWGYNENKQVISELVKVSWANIDQEYILTATITNDVKYIRACYYTNDTDLLLTIDGTSFKNVYGGYVDLISGELVETNVAETFTSTPTNNTSYDAEDSIYFGLNSSYPFVSIYSSGAIVSTRGVGTAPRNGLCNSLKISYIDNWRGTQYINSLCSQYLLDGFSVRMSKDLFNLEDGYTGQEKQNAINEYLLANPIIVYYELKNHIIHQLTPTQLQSFVGQNNFWSNADYVEIEYDLIETEDIQKCRKKIILNQPHTEFVIGDVANFSTNIKAPLKECKVYFSPIQEGSGDPSPDNVRNIVGWDEINVGLPSEYQEVEYIESTGTQYIITDIPIQQPVTIYIDVMPLSGSNDQAFFTTGYEVSPHLVRIGTGWYAGRIQNYYQRYYTLGASNSMETNTKHHAEVYLSQGLQTAVLDGTQLPNTSNTHNSTLLPIDGNKINFFMFAEGRLRASGKIDALFKSHARIYALKVDNADSTIGNFIPCYRKSDGEIGMYDTVSKTFYTNSGTGTFLKGDDVNTIIGNVNWLNEIGTVYGGYVDLVKGELVGNWIKRDLSEMSTINAPNTSLDEPWNHRFVIENWDYNNSGWDKASGRRNFIIDNIANDNKGKTNFTAVGIDNSPIVYIYDNTIFTVEEFKTKYSEHYICYETKYPIHYSLTPQQLLTFKGENNIWSDTNGQTEVKFWTH